MSTRWAAGGSRHLAGTYRDREGRKSAVVAVASPRNHRMEDEKLVRDALEIPFTSQDTRFRPHHGVAH